MTVTKYSGTRIALAVAPLATLFLAAVASAQGRGMMMPMQPMTMPMQSAMMNQPRMIPTGQATVLLALLRQREAVLVQAVSQVQAAINALEMTRPTMNRNATIMALQRQQAVLELQLRQTTAQIALLGG